MSDQDENLNNSAENLDTNDSFEDITHEDDVTIEGAEPNEEAQNNQAQEDSPEANTNEKKEELTNKGTKLADDPLSRANQLRANAEAKAREYETVLNDPQALERYLKVLKGEQTQTDSGNNTEIKLEDVQTTEDLQKFLKQEREKDRKEIEGVKQQISGQTALNQYDADLTAVRKEFPNMTESQEDLIGFLFETTNFDQQGNYAPKVRLSDIAKKVMSIAEESKKDGSKQAQTIVRNARAGRNVSGAVSESKIDESKLTAEQVIANRFRVAGLRRK